MLRKTIIALMCVLPALAFATEPEAKQATKVLFIGDSMTGWLSERLNAYGQKNGFEVSTVVWDGSTIKKWADSPRTAQIIAKQDPDVIFVSLGMNELFEKNPQARFGSSMDKLKRVFGARTVIWVGPPKWVGKSEGTTMDKWLGAQVGKDYYFSSLNLDIPRQSKTNQHPTKPGMAKWMDSVVKWLRDGNKTQLNLTENPEAGAMSRGKTFVYKRMKEAL